MILHLFSLLFMEYVCKISHINILFSGNVTKLKVYFCVYQRVHYTFCILSQSHFCSIILKIADGSIVYMFLFEEQFLKCLMQSAIALHREKINNMFARLFIAYDCMWLKCKLPMQFIITQFN